MVNGISPAELGSVTLDPGLFEQRRALNHAYLDSLTDENLLQNHRLEAGIASSFHWHLRPGAGDPSERGLDRHWGWETPGGSQMRGHFLGHWLSAAAREAAATGDAVLRARAHRVVAELERCQEANGGEWVFGVPPVFLDRVAAGREVWAPQYNLHKTLMGLVDAARDLGDQRALEVARRAGRWFARWSASFTREQFDDVLDVETGGMLEVWADLLELTGDEVFRDLLERYYRARLFDPLVAGVDVLTNTHANTTIPEVLGAARAFEVTGERRWADVVHAYWRCAVTERGTFATGGQTSGEVWTPPFEFAARRGGKNQEHCVVHNTIRLADVLFRWTGDSSYLDHVERNLYNGILAQQNPRTGMVAYFLPLAGGSRKRWGHPTEDFWCCHGTLVQAHTRHSSYVFYEDARADALVVAQFVNATWTARRPGGPVTVQVARSDSAVRVGPDANAGAAGDRHRPQEWRVSVTVVSGDDVPARVRVRVPGWVHGGPAVSTAGGEEVRAEAVDGFLVLDHRGGRSEFHVTLPHRLRAEPVPDEPTTVAFVVGPLVLAGLTDAETALVVDDLQRPEAHLAPDDERQWAEWLRGYRTTGQERSTRLVPLHEVVDQDYSVYFPLRTR
ncbi:beta-L-arabinofuranosidase domain-containing protein [Kineococcus terrestris]|uniref:beta-L-arabinofuranosidase domain-containing protein n=1 Tax=Kineococcus terrestris TaxID=2044856 RepID=UPI0034DB1600